jgi:hypothetical protein
LNLPAIIDAIIEHSEEVDPRDYNAIRLRKRVWLRAIEILQEIWDSWDWDFRYKVDGSMTLTSGQDTATAPSDFHALAYEGAVWLPAPRNSPLFERPSFELMEIRRSNPTAQGFPQRFCVFGGDDTGLPTFQFDRLADQTYTLQLDYEKRPPALVDRPDDLTASVEDGVSTLTAGVYQFKLVYVTADGASLPSDAVSATVVDSNADTITLTFPEPPSWSQVTSKSLYMTPVGTSTFRLHTASIANSTTSQTVTAPVSGSADLIETGFSGLERLPEGLFGVLLAGLKEELGYDEGDSRSGGEAEGRFRKRLARFKREYPAFERKGRMGDLALTQYRMH